MKRKRVLAVAMLAALTSGSLFAGGCSSNFVQGLLFKMVGVTALDLFVSPLVGDNCTLLNRSGC